VPSKMLIADDSEIVRRGIRQILSSQNEFEIVGEAQDFVKTSRLIRELNPDVVVLDVHMPGEITFLSNEFKSQLRGSRLLAISIWADEQTRQLAYALGAVALLQKANLGATLIPTIMEMFQRPV
jgi:DNA-binding NarL/FixJ family response regulator